jgi:nucleoside-diphosphate-sugar epimerase
VPPHSVRQWIEHLPQPVAVTGGTGFVGSHLVDTLVAAGLAPRVLVRAPESPRWIADRPVDWVAGSLEDSAALETLVAGAATVFHSAGVVMADTADEFDRGNRDGTRRLVEAVRTRSPKARLIHVSSLAAVGPAADAAGVGPDATPSPVSNYGRSKLEAEYAVSTAGEDLWWVIVRPPAIYGPRDTDMFELFRMAGKGVALVPWGERWISVAHVADVVRCLLASACGEAHRVYHLGNPTPSRLDRLFHTLASAGGGRVRVVPVPPISVNILAGLAQPLRRLGVISSALTRDKAREARERFWTSRTRDSLDVLGVGEQLPLSDGARSTWAWYREQGWLG